MKSSISASNTMPKKIKKKSMSFNKEKKKVKVIDKKGFSKMVTT